MGSNARGVLPRPAGRLRTAPPGRWQAKGHNVKNPEQTALPLRTIEVSGRPQSMGQCFGEEFAAEIRELTALRMDRLVDFVRKYDADRRIGREDVLELSRRTVAAHRRFDAAIWEEFCGIARSAGLSVEELLIGNGFTDFRDFVLFQSKALRRGRPGHVGECTAFLVPGECADKGRPVLLTAGDVRQLQLVKGSIAAGTEILCREMGVGFEDLEEVLLAGAFGNYVQKTSALEVGLVPPVEAERVRFVGNAAGIGARMVLADSDSRRRALALAESTEYVELAGRADYQSAFASAMLFHRQ